jgi:hypothetical protein
MPSENPEPPRATAAGAHVERILLGTTGELQATLASVPEWAAQAGHLGVRESDLQRAVCRAVQSQLGSVAAVEGPLPPAVKEHWGGWLGRADVLARPTDGSEIYFETKLCGNDRLYEAVWDMLKLALMTALDGRTSGYLLYAAPVAAWQLNQSELASIFETRVLALTDLLFDRYPDPWEWCLEATRSTRPISLPAHVRTERAGSCAIAVPGGDWELRCVLVEGDPAAGWIDFGSDGWPDVEEGEPEAPAVHAEAADDDDPPAEDARSAASEAPRG